MKRIVNPPPGPIKLKTCKNNHEYVVGHGCQTCNNERTRLWRLKHKNYVSEQNKLHRAKNKDSLIAYTRAWRLKNPFYYKARQQNFPERFRESTMRRKAAKLQRTPKWLTEGDLIEIKWAYLIAATKTKATGVEYQVDHIVPLQGKNVSGLHVPWNLQVISKSENCKKNNRFE